MTKNLIIEGLEDAIAHAKGDESKGKRTDHYRHMNQMLRAATMNDRAYYYNSQLRQASQHSLGLYEGTRYGSSVTWSDFDGSIHSSSVQHCTSPKIARFAVLRAAVRMGYTRPKWWQWWRWNERHKHVPSISIRPNFLND